MSGTLIAQRFFIPECLWELPNFFFFFFLISLSKKSLGSFPARILFSLNFTSFSSWVFLPHSELLVSLQCWSLLSRTSFPFVKGPFIPSLGRGRGTARVKLQSVIHSDGLRQCTQSKFESKRNMKSKECVHTVYSFKTFTHFSTSDLVLFNPLNHAKT